MIIIITLIITNHRTKTKNKTNKKIRLKNANERIQLEPVWRKNLAEIKTSLECERMQLQAATSNRLSKGPLSEWLLGREPHSEIRTSVRANAFSWSSEVFLKVFLGSPPCPSPPPASAPHCERFKHSSVLQNSLRHRRPVSTYLYVASSRNHWMSNFPLPFYVTRKQRLGLGTRCKSEFAILPAINGSVRESWIIHNEISNKSPIVFNSPIHIELSSNFDCKSGKSNSKLTRGYQHDHWVSIILP